MDRAYQNPISVTSQIIGVPMSVVIKLLSTVIFNSALVGIVGSLFLRSTIQ